ncbi:MAG: hypothetical protein K6T30_03365, partial [Alicyclobacillus sp.]|nr:hypothetical protein [Alicyclobacillus sp.]
FKVDGKWGGCSLELKMTGLFNVYNALAAFTAAAAMGVPMEVIKGALENTRGVPGRFELVNAGQDFAVIVDYAHTAESLAKVLQIGRTLTQGRVLAVFGSAGERDTDKRPKMGAVAAGQVLNPQRRIRSDGGGTLVFTVCAFAVCSGLLAGMALYVADTAADVEALHALQRQAYWLARGTAKLELAKAEHGTLAEGDSEVSYSAGTVHTTVRNESVWTVEVIARTPASQDVVTFVYDPQQGRVTQWQEDGPP